MKVVSLHESIETLIFNDKFHQVQGTEADTSFHENRVPQYNDRIYYIAIISQIN